MSPVLEFTVSENIESSCLENKVLKRIALDTRIHGLGMPPSTVIPVVVLGITLDIKTIS